MKRVGYGQVEPNHLSAPRTGQVYAQLPAMNGNTPIAQLENGQFLKYDYANKCAGVGTSGDGKEWFLVFNEEKLYDERRQNHKDFVVKASDMVDKTIYPRLLKINVGDIFTTNTFRSTGNSPATVTGPDDEITMPDLAISDYLQIDSAGWLVKYTAGTGEPDVPATGMVFQVVPHFTQIENAQAVYTLPDKQPAVKVQRIK